MGNPASILDTLMASVVSPVCVTDATGRITRRNAAFAALTAAETHCADYVRQVLDNGTPQAGIIHLPGHAEPWALTATPVVEADKVVGAIVILRPAAAAHATPADGLDKLTGLPGRHLFFDRVDQMLHHAGRAQKSVAVILVGIERLGQITDVLGSEAIDRILRDIAERLRQCVRVSDTVARLDNERFAFVMQIAAINDSVLVTEKILHAFEQPFTFGQHEDVVIGCALGVSIYPADGASGEALVKSASAALHHAAQSGSNQCHFFSNEMNDRARHRLTVESGIRRGLTNREFLVYYQPKIDVNNTRVAGMEALIRWRDPERGLVSPAEFIPVAEESGLIEQIDFLRAHGCELVQGFYYSRPLPAEEFALMLRNGPGPRSA